MMRDAWASANLPVQCARQPNLIKALKNTPKAASEQQPGSGL